MFTKSYSILLLLIIFISLFTRVFQLGNIPVSLYWDEAAIGYDAYSISQTGKDMHGKNWLQPIFLSYGDYKAPVYIWLTSLSIKLLGPTPFAIRLPSALAGVVIVYCLFLIIKLMFNSTKIALFSAMITAVTPWAIHFSRTGFEAHLSLMFSVLSIYFLLQGLKNSSLSIIFSSIFAVLSIYSYFSARISLPLVLLAIILINYRSALSKIIYLSLSTTIILIFLIPLFKSPYYTPSNNFRLSTPSLLNTQSHILLQNQLRDLNHNSIISRLVYHRHVLFSYRLLTQLTQYTSLNSIFFKGDVNLRHGTGQTGLLLPVTLPLFIAGLIVLFKKYRTYLLLLFLWWLFGILPAVIPLTPLHALRSLLALPVFMITTGLGGYWLFIKIKSKYNIIPIILSLSITFSFSVYWHDYLTHYKTRSATDWQDGYAQLVNTIKPYAVNNPIYISPFDNRFYLYLLLYLPYPPQNTQLLKDQTFPANLGNFYFDKSNLPTNILSVITIEDAQKLQIKPEQIITTSYSSNQQPEYYLVSGVVN